MPIYRVEFEGEIMIYSADGEPDHYDILDAVREELSGMGSGVDGLCIWPPALVKPTTHLGDWADSRPYEREDDKTCAQIMAEEAEAEKRRPPTAEEVEAAGQQRLIA